CPRGSPRRGVSVGAHVRDVVATERVLDIFAVRQGLALATHSRRGRVADSARRQHGGQPRGASRVTRGGLSSQHEAHVSFLSSRGSPGFEAGNANVFRPAPPRPYPLPGRATKDRTLDTGTARAPAR